MLNLEITARIPTLVYLTYRSGHIALWYFIKISKEYDIELETSVIIFFFGKKLVLTSPPDISPYGN